MSILKTLILAAAVAGSALAGDVVVPVPEVGMDGPTITSVIGVIGGGLLILRARRKK